MKGMEKAGIEYHLYIQKPVFSKDYSDEKVTGMIKNYSAQHEKIEINMAKLNRAIFEMLTREQQQQAQSNLITFSERLKKMQ
jgi:Spy/CpxP family protein refolding chaperone